MNCAKTTTFSVLQNFGGFMTSLAVLLRLIAVFWKS